MTVGVEKYGLNAKRSTLARARARFFQFLDQNFQFFFKSFFH
jgi:hypothetical protein